MGHLPGPSLHCHQGRFLRIASGHYLPNGDAAAGAAVNAFRNHGFQVSDERYINKIFDFKSKKWVKK